MNINSDSGSGNIQCTPSNIVNTAKNINYVNKKSSERYEFAYTKFMDWHRTHNISSFSQNVLLAYFEELSESTKPNTLWTQYSMLRSTLNSHNEVDIGNYQKLKALLRQKSDGYVGKKSKTLTEQEINKFLNEAPDEKYLFMKVALIFGLNGACRKHELADLKIDDIEDLGRAILIRINDTKSIKPRSFTVTGRFYTIYKKYAQLRPSDVPVRRFFLNYQKEKCTNQPVGVNKFGSIPKEIATYLKLKEPHLYTGHSFRRSAATILGQAGEDIIALKRHDLATSAKDESFKEEMVTDTHFIDIGDTQSQGPSTSRYSGGNKVSNETVCNTDDDEEEAYLEGADEEEIDFKDLDADQISTQIINLQKVELPEECNASSANTALPPPLVPIQSNTINPTSTKQYPTTLECDLFGEYVSKHLQELPLDVALKLQCGIQNLVMKTRLEHVRQNPDEAPPMVKQEVSEDYEEIEQMPETSNTNSNNHQESLLEKRRLDQEPSSQAKRHKSNNKPTTTNTKSSSPASKSQQMKSKRTNCVVFAEQIAVQLEQLPEELALQLQSDIYAMITQALPEFSKDDPPGRIWIKTETIQDSPTNTMNEYYEN